MYRAGWEVTQDEARAAGYFRRALEINPANQQARRALSPPQGQ
jgi:hypothetical protein